MSRFMASETPARISPGWWLKMARKSSQRATRKPDVYSESGIDIAEALKHKAETKSLAGLRGAKEMDRRRHR